MRILKAKYAVKTLCECKWTVLRDEVPLGTVFFIDLDSLSSGGMICGGCGRVTGITLAMCVGGGVNCDSSGGLLPVEILDFGAEGPWQNETVN